MITETKATKKDNSLCVQFGCNRKSTCGDYCSQHCNCNRKPQQTHYLKTWKEYYQQVVAGIKEFEVRKNDRDFREGDIVCLQEFDNETGLYTGAIFKTTISYILKGGQFGIEEGYVVFGFRKFKI